ncbi:MAG TPA: hypothetical protein VKY74_28285 [Chloroflexia bacterium]|nr:hypothetical protein [Chloroflexia bacterium]
MAETVPRGVTRLYSDISAPGQASADLAAFAATSVAAGALPAAFPPIRTLDQQATNLSPQLYPLIGRDQEVATAERRLRDPAVRLLTLTGAAGTGKTRLAIQVAARVEETLALRRPLGRPKDIGAALSNLGAESRMQIGREKVPIGA